MAKSAAADLLQGTETCKRRKPKASTLQAQAMYQGFRHPGHVPSLPFQM